MGSFESFIGVDFWTALFVLLNTLAIFFLARKLLFKPVSKLISDRQAEIDGMYKKAEEAEKNAAVLESEYKARLAEAQSEGDRLIKEAADRAEKRGSEIVEDAKNQASALLDKAQRDALSEKKKAVNEAKGEIASLALSIAEKVVEKQLGEGDSSRMTDELISRLGTQDE